MTSMYFKTEAPRTSSMYGKTEQDLRDNFYRKPEHNTLNRYGEETRQPKPPPKQSPLEKKQPVEKPQMPKSYGGMSGGMSSRGTMFHNPSALQRK